MELTGGEEKSKSSKLLDKIREKDAENENIKQAFEQERQENKNNQAKAQK